MDHPNKSLSAFLPKRGFCRGFFSGLGRRTVCGFSVNVLLEEFSSKLSDPPISVAARFRKKSLAMFAEATGTPLVGFKLVSVLIVED